MTARNDKWSIRKVTPQNDSRPITKTRKRKASFYILFSISKTTKKKNAFEFLLKFQFHNSIKARARDKLLFEPSSQHFSAKPYLEREREKSGRKNIAETSARNIYCELQRANQIPSGTNHIHPTLPSPHTSAVAAQHQPRPPILSALGNFSNGFISASAVAGQTIYKTFVAAC